MELSDKFEELAELKSRKKELESQIKDIESEIFNSEEDWPKQVQTENGKLVHNHKVTYTTPNNFVLINNGILNEYTILEHSKLNSSTIKKLVGAEKFNELVETNVVGIKSETDYFTLQ